MNRPIILIVLIFICLVSIAEAQESPFSFGNVSVQRVDRDFYNCDTLGPVCTSAPLSPYGGWDLNKVEATGFFHVREIDDNWYLIDPLGCLFVSIGVTSVARGGGINLPDDLKEFYFNNLGMWSDVSIKNIPVSPRFNFLSGFKNTSSERKDLFYQNIFPVFDPEFEIYCDTEAEKFVAPYINNAWVLGYYSDNELALHKIILDDYLALPSGNPNQIAANQWMIDRKGAAYTVAEIDRMEFKGFVASTYASAVRKSLKKYDPNHLYIGCRLHGGAKYDKYILRGIGEHVDVNSINFYARWEPSDEDMNLWLREAGKPFLITEFYTKAEDSGLSNVNGAGWEVYTQADRAYHFENFALRLLSHKGSVGWTWFRYIDKDDSNKGILNYDYQWYTTLLSSMSKIGKDVYNLRKFLMGQELDLAGDPACFDISSLTFVISDMHGNPISEAEVNLSDKSALTDENGETTFVEVPVDEDLPFSVEKFAYERFEGSATMVKNNDTVFIELEALSYNVAITVKNEDDKALKDAIVSLSGYGAMMSDVAGLVSFEKVLPGNNMVYSVSRLGYRDTANILNVVDEDVSLTLILKDDGSGLSNPSIKIGSIKLFPVPANDYVILSSGKNVGELSVYSMSGLALYNEAIIADHTRIDVSPWQAGLYIVRMKDADTGSLRFAKINISR